MTAAAFSSDRSSQSFIDPVTRALAWRFVRNGWASMLAVLGITCIIPTMLLWLIRLQDKLVADAMHEVMAPLQRIFFLFDGVGMPTLVLILLLQMVPLFTQPVTTRRLVQTHFVLGVLSITALHVFTVIYYAVCFGVSVPLLGGLAISVPTLFILSGLAALVVDARLWRAILFVALLAGFGGTCMWRFETDAVIGRSGGWLTPTMPEFLALLVSAVCGYAYACRTAVRARHGDLQSWRVAEEYLLRSLKWLGRFWPWSLSFRFHSPIQAQYRFGFWSRGAAVPLIAALVCVPIIIGACFEPTATLAGWVGAIPVSLGMFLVISGFVVGHTSSVDKTMEMDLYRATRPLSDRQLAYAAINTALFSTLLAMGVVLVLGVILFGVALIFEGGRLDVAIRHVEFAGVRAGENLWTFCPLMLNGGITGWMAFGVILTIMLSGRIWMVLAAMALGISGLLIGLTAEEFFGVEFARRLQVFGGCSLALAMAVFTIWCFVVTYGKELIAARHAVIGACLWIAGVIVYPFMFPGMDTPIPNVGTFMLIGAMSLMALPLASTPLAVWWNRHR